MMTGRFRHIRGLVLLLLLHAASLAAEESPIESPAASEPVPAAVPPTAPAVPVTELTMEPFKLLGSSVEPGQTLSLIWSASQNFAGMALETPVLVSHGTQPGPVLCLTAAVHGDELNGIEIVRRVLFSTNAKKLRGTLIGVPIVNLHGFQRSSRYLADRRDLNRHFPGNLEGSSASRIADSFFRSVVKHCDALVDLHTGSFHRTNLIQLRADLSDPRVVALTSGFGATAVLDDKGAVGTLRRAAVEVGIPAVTLEAGEPTRLQLSQVEDGTKVIKSLMHDLGMLKKGFVWNEPQPVYYESSWIRADRGGILMSTVALGAKVKKGDLLATITDPITNKQSLIYAPYDGLVLGMALNQVVMPGFAAFHIGIERPTEEVVTEAEAAAEKAAEKTVEEAVTPSPEPPSAPSAPAAPVEYDEEPVEAEEVEEDELMDHPE